MANRKEALASEVERSKSYSMDEFMGAYLRGELELKPDGKVQATVKSGKGKPKWLLVPKSLSDIPEHLVIDDMYKWHQHTDQNGKKYHVFGLKASEWKAHGYSGKLVKRFVSEIEDEFTRVHEGATNFDAEFEQEMLGWERGEDKN